MTISGQLRLDTIRQRARQLRRWMTVLLVTLWLLLVLENFGALAVELLVKAYDPSWLHRAALKLTTACPQVFYLFALAGIRHALMAMGEGALFQHAVSRMLDRVGTMLAIGAFIGVFVLPSAERALGMDPGYWIAFDVAGVVLGAVGLCLGVVARVLAHAGTVQAELDEIF